MNTLQHTTRWLGLALTCGIITFAASAQAGKPVKPPKPPPEPPPAAPYELIMLGDAGSDSHAIDVNESGLVVGSVSYYFPEGYSYSHATLVVPEMENGNLIWRKDADGDGQNDLLVDLGTPAGADSNSGPCNINDHGVILGGALHPVPDQAPNDFAWLLAPKVVDGRLTWTDLDQGGVNGLIEILPVVGDLEDPYLVALPQHINNHGEVALVVQSWNPSDRWQRGFLLIPNRYEVSVDGAVTIEYPAADLDGDGLNDYLIDLGSGARVLDGAARPLLPTVINDQGDVAGMVWGRAIGDVCGERPFVLRPRVDENGGLIWNEENAGLNDLAVYLPLPDEVIDAASRYVGISSVNDMNESGTIIGTVYYGAPKGSRAAIWQVDWEAGTVSYAELGLLNSRYDYTDPCALNASGQVVGRSLRYTRDDVYQKGWLWEQGDMMALGELVAAETGLADISSVALGINDRGMIVGAQQAVYPGNWTSFIAVPVEQP